MTSNTNTNTNEILKTTSDHGSGHVMGMADLHLDAWASTIGRIRKYAAGHARRGWVILDAHTPKFNMVRDGVSLLDFNSFPLRIKEIESEPYHAKLEKDYLDSLYGRSMGCKTPSGWECENLPYLVEFDNFGRTSQPGVANHASHFVWGWDEISWLAIQPEDYRNEWLRYAHQWLLDNDPNGHLEMPGMRVIYVENETGGNYRANTRSESCPYGYSQESTIKSIWTAEDSF